MAAKGKGAFHLNGDGKSNAAHPEPDIREFVKMVLSDVESLQGNLRKFPRYTAAFQTEKNCQEELRAVEQERDRLKGELRTSQRNILELGAECNAYRQEVDVEYKEKSKGVEKLERDAEKAKAELEKLREEKRGFQAKLEERFEAGQKRQKGIDSAQVKPLMDEVASLREDVSALKEKVKEGDRALEAEREKYRKMIRDEGYIKAGLEKEKDGLRHKLALLTSFREELGETDKCELEQLQVRVAHNLPPGSPFGKIYQSGSAAEGHLCRAAVQDIINRALCDNVLQHPVLLLSKMPPAGLKAALQALGREKESALRLLAVEVLEELEELARGRPDINLRSHLNQAAADVVKHTNTHMEESLDCESLEIELKEEFQDAERMWLGMQKAKVGIVASLDVAEPPSTDPDSDQTTEFCLSLAYIAPVPLDDSSGQPGATSPASLPFVAGTALHRGSQPFQMNVQEKKEFDDLREKLAQRNHVASPALEGGEFGEAGGGETASGGMRILRRSGTRVARPSSMVVP